jgi:hypothetical protein
MPEAISLRLIALRSGVGAANIREATERKLLLGTADSVFESPVLTPLGCDGQIQASPVGKFILFSRGLAA